MGSIGAGLARRYTWASHVSSGAEPSDSLNACRPGLGNAEASITLHYVVVPSGVLTAAKATSYLVRRPVAQNFRSTPCPSRVSALAVIGLPMLPPCSDRS